MRTWILQTYFHWHELEERGFSREFLTKQEAEAYAKNNACGSRHTITPWDHDEAEDCHAAQIAADGWEDDSEQDRRTR